MSMIWLSVQGSEAPEEEVLRLLKIIQEFEPAGVGARDLKECLLLQIQHKLNENPEHKPLQDAKATFGRMSLEEFSRKHYEKYPGNYD